MCVNFDDSRAISFSYLLMLYTTPVVNLNRRSINNVKKGLVMQEPIESIAFWQRVTTAPYKGMVDSTSIEGVTSIPWVESMDKGMVSKRVIIVGCNGPTKRNVTPEGIS